MIYKSYLVENNFNIIKNNIVLFYGENLGLLDQFRETIKKNAKESKIIIFDQEQITKISSLLFEELNNKSLFEETKIIIINNCNDKILEIIRESINILKDNKIYLFSSELEKKSKIRTFFEKEKNLAIVPCYKDNQITIKTLISKELKNYMGLTPNIINYLSENVSLDRMKLTNEINKIKTYFLNTAIDYKKLEKLLNLKEDDDFNDIKNHAINGDLKITNNRLSTCVFDSGKSIYYLGLINQRLNKLNEIDLQKNNLEKSISELRPPIFWKEKTMFIAQAKLWNKNKLNRALTITYDCELRIKSNSDINQKILLKKLIIDVCNLANAA